MKMLLLLTVAVLSNCAAATLTNTELMNPESCGSCHPDQFREWSGSMHAYASEDPVFVAMNARGQRETQGALGTFCVNCHAPLAVRTGATMDGLNLKQLPKSMQGVTCFFCHTVDAVEGTHNNPLRLASDSVMRGGISDPVSNRAHKSGYSALHDRDNIASANMCGSCHDIVTPAGVHLERTFKEWKESLFANDKPGFTLTCGGCHMQSRMAVAADAPGVGIRKVHDHSMPGVDVALTPFPETEAQRRAVQRDLDSTIGVTICVTEMNIEVTVDNIAAGHSWPSGANQDRRAWVEVVAHDADGGMIFESGVVADDEAVMESASDPRLWLMSDKIFDSANREVHMFWEASSFQSRQVPGVMTNKFSDPRYLSHRVSRAYFSPAATSADRITAQVRLRPFGLEVIDDLIASGDLDPAIRSRVPTFNLNGSRREWRRADSLRCTE